MPEKTELFLVLRVYAKGEPLIPIFFLGEKNWLKWEARYSMKLPKIGHQRFSNYSHNGCIVHREIKVEQRDAGLQTTMLNWRLLVRVWKLLKPIKLW